MKPIITSTACLRRSLRNLLYHCLFVVLVLSAPLSAQLGYTQPLPAGNSVFEAPNFELRFTYPSQMRIYDTGHQNVVVALSAVHPTTGERAYPSFNVIVRPGNLEPGALETFEENVLTEYRHIGLTSVKPVFAHELFFNGTTERAPYVQLEYQSRGEVYTADIAAVPGPDHHFILTYLDQKRDYPKDEGIRDILFSSFELTRPLPNPRDNVRARYRDLPSADPLRQEDVIAEGSEGDYAEESSYVGYQEPNGKRNSPTFYALLLIGGIGLMALFSTFGKGQKEGEA